jgi:hypothetical protein
MAEPAEPENLTLRYLRRIDERLDTVDRKLDELMMRMSAIERDVTTMLGPRAGTE